LIDEPASFASLMESIRQGDNDAATEMVRRYEGQIRRVVRFRLMDSRLRRQFDSVDICQSVLGSFFVRAALGEFDLERPEQLVHLLATMARNRLINHAQKQQAGRRDVRRLCPEDAGSLELAANCETPSQIVSGKELIGRFLGCLSDEERRIYDRRLQGDGWAEIAADLGENPDAVRMRYTRAVSRVQRELGLEELGDDS